MGILACLDCDYCGKRFVSDPKSEIHFMAGTFHMSVSAGYKHPMLAYVRTFEDFRACEACVTAVLTFIEDLRKSRG